MSSAFDGSTIEPGPKRRSFPGVKDGVKGPGTEFAVTASTSQSSQAPAFKSKQSSWLSKAVRREAPLIGLLTTGTATVVLNQVIADQVPTVLCLFSNVIAVKSTSPCHCFG